MQSVEVLFLLCFFAHFFFVFFFCRFTTNFFSIFFWQKKMGGAHRAMRQKRVYIHMRTSVWDNPFFSWSNLSTQPKDSLQVQVLHTYVLYVAPLKKPLEELLNLNKHLKLFLKLLIRFITSMLQRAQIQVVSELDAHGSACVPVLPIWDRTHCTLYSDSPMSSSACTIFTTFKQMCLLSR